jgi:hypothetical protein
VKPPPPFKGSRFPQTDYFFQSGGGRWDGYSGEDWHFRRSSLGREYLIESARERAKEMAVFGVIVIAAAWPVIYMIFTVWQVLHRQQPDQ